MKIKIKYFAMMRETRKLSEEIIDTHEKTVGHLYDELNKEHHFPLKKENVKPAVNEHYVSFNHVLKENDTVVFIPPVSGG